VIYEFHFIRIRYCISECIVGTIIINNILVQSYNIIHEPITTDSLTQIFVASTAVYSASLFVIFRYIGSQPRENIQNDNTFRLAIIGSKITQYILLFLMAFLVLEIVLFSSHIVIILILIALISYIYAAIIMSFFAFKLLQWMKKVRNKTVLLFAISGILIIVNLLSSLIYTQASLLGIDPNYIVIDHPGNDNRFLTSEPLFYYMYLISSIFAFFSSWTASIFFVEKLLSQVSSNSFLDYYNYSFVLLHQSI
jgi:hypothetical protein